MHINFRILPVFFALLLFSCTQEPADIVLHATTSPAKNAAGLHNPYRVTVQKGDTLYSIARKNNVEIRAMIDINRLRPPYILIAGQTVKLPKAAFHIVGESDNLFAISRSYNVDVSRLAQKNHLTPPYNITKGQKLLLPSPAENESAASVDTAPVSYDYDTKAVATSSSSVAAEELAPLGASPTLTTGKPPENNDDDEASPFGYSRPQPSTPTKPTELFAEDAAPTETATVSAQKPLAAKTADTTQLKSEPVDESNPFTVPEKIDTAPDKPANSKANETFSWPLKGNIISRFGPKKGGLYNDGVNIAAKEGAPVKAAAAGEVVYAGNELRGYGNILLIKHNNGYLTAYAHTDDFLVKKGDVIKQGQVIAHVGQTGHVSSPQLHFSIRQGRKAINPEKYLPADFAM